MSTLLSHGLHKARKDYPCDAWYWINYVGVRDIGLTFAEYREVVKARRNNFTIKKGEQYYRQVVNDGGYLYTYRAIPALHDICIKYEIYGE